VADESESTTKPCFKQNDGREFSLVEKEIILDEKERAVLLEFYKENATQGRHHETQRSTSTTISFAFAGAAIGLLAKQGGITRDDLPLTILLALESHEAGRAKLCRKRLNEG